MTGRNANHNIISDGTSTCVRDVRLTGLLVYYDCSITLNMRSLPSRIIATALSRVIDTNISSLCRDTKVRHYDTITTKRLTACAQFLPDPTQRRLVRLKVESMVDKPFRRHRPTSLYNAIVVGHNDTHTERRPRNLERRGHRARLLPMKRVYPQNALYPFWEC